MRRLNPVAAARLRQHRKLIKVAGAVVIALLLYGYWRLQPYLTVKRFVAAVERGDVKTLVAMAHPTEIEKCGVNAEGLRKVMRGALGEVGTYRAIRIVRWHSHPLADSVGEMAWIVVWGDAQTGEPLFAPWRYRGKPRAIQMQLDVRPTGWLWGWKPVVSTFEASLLGIVETPMPRHKRAMFLREIGLKGTLGYPSHRVVYFPEFREHPALNRPREGEAEAKP